MAKLEPFLKQMKAIDDLVKGSKNWIPASNLFCLKTKALAFALRLFSWGRIQKRPQAVTPGPVSGAYCHHGSLTPVFTLLRLRHQLTIAAVIIPARIGAAGRARKSWQTARASYSRLVVRQHFAAILELFWFKISPRSVSGYTSQRAGVFSFQQPMPPG